MIRLEQVRGEMLERFERVDRRFAQNEQRLGRIDQRLNEITDRVEVLRLELLEQLELLALSAVLTGERENGEDLQEKERKGEF
jgi:hypothetical protein